MKKRNKRLALCLALLLFLSGCQLAKPETEEAAAGNDRLIGAFITREPLDLFDFERYIQDNQEKFLQGGEAEITGSEAYENRLYAARTEDERYVFEDAEGFCFFVVEEQDESGSRTASYGDEAVSSGGIHITEKDEEAALALEGTIYVSSQAANALGFVSFYFNPVYQGADGGVYTVSGQGMSFDGAMTASQTLDEAVTVTENGETRTKRTTVKISVTVIDAPEEIVVLQMSAAGQLLARDAYEPDTLPETMTPLNETAYLIVETVAQSGITRELVERDETTIETFRAREDGVCVKEYTELAWGA